MQKINTILADAENILDTEISPTTGTDFTRIANALERIATALEKLSGDTTNTPAPITKNRETNVIQHENKTGATLQNLKPNNSVPPAVKHGIVENYLTERGLTETVQDKLISDKGREKKLNELASYLGQHFCEVKGFYQLLKKKIHTPAEVMVYPIKELMPNQRTAVKKLRDKLEDLKLIEQLAPKGLAEDYIELKFAVKGQNYLTGEWFERYVEQRVKSILKKHFPANTPRQYRPNIKIKLKDGSEVELDYFFALKKKVFCIEAKTNTDLQELRSYLKRIGPLELENRVLIVIAEKSEEECLKLSQALNGINVTGLNNFEDALTAMIKAACDAPQNKTALG